MNGESKLAATALAYLKRGWRSIPLESGGKRPIGTNCQAMRLEAKELLHKFSDGKNLGLLLGEPSGGLADIDLDCSHALKLASSFLPATGAIFGRTTKPRSHWLYQVTPGDFRTIQFSDPTKSKNDDKGRMLIELRGTGAQTMAPPSLHPCGEPVEWGVDHDAAHVEFGALQTAVKTVAAAALLARHWPTGNRHVAALALAGALIRSRWPEGRIEDFVFQVARAAKDEEAQNRLADVRSTVRKFADGQAVTGAPTCNEIFGDLVWDKVRQWLALEWSSTGAPPQWEPPIPFSQIDPSLFPADALPDWLRLFVEALTAATQTPPDLAGVLGLAALSLANARKIQISVREGYSEPANLYLVVALPPAERKSPVFSAVTSEIENFEKSEAEAAAPEVAAAESRFRILDGRLKKAESAAAQAKADGERQTLEEMAQQLAKELGKMKVPVSPRYVADDCTPERLSTLLRDQNGRMAILSPEGRIFDILAGRYSVQGQGPNFEVFLKGHAGDTLRVDRVKRPPEFVQKPALTLGLAVQPEVLRGLAFKPGFRGRGLLARFLYSLPASRLGSRKTGVPSVPPEVRAAYTRNLRRMLNLSCAREPDGTLREHVLKFDAAALARLRQWEAEIEPMLAPGGELGGISDWGGKLFGATIRIAGNLHMTEYVGDREPWGRLISVEMVERAIRLARYFITHVKAAFAEMGADPDIEGARHVLAWIVRSSVTEFSKRDAYQATRGRFQRVSALEPPLSLLVEQEFIRPKTGGSPPGPGRKPSPLYQVNPYTQNSHNTPILFT